MNDQLCDIFWGSHGCDLPIGHEGLHVCRACCNDALDHRAAHLAADVNSHGVEYCAGMWPYYGEKNMADNLMFFRAARGKLWEKLPDEFARLKKIVEENGQSERQT